MSPAPHDVLPDPFYSPTPPRISGTAMPHGVFLSTGTASTGSALSLFVTGFCIVSVGILSLIPTYMIAWLLDQRLHLSLPSLLLQVGGPVDPLSFVVGRICVNLLAFLAFLAVLRLSPLAGHHAAEHMTVHAIERYGVYAWPDYVADMPRAHPRCGSNLLAGILPVMLVAAPLFAVAPGPAIIVAVLGFAARRPVGFFLQNTFTTKPPSPRQLARGIDAGRRLLEQWLRNPAPRLTRAQQLLKRGVPQLIAGVICALYTIGVAMDHVHVLLDW